jgi:methyl-accepting chemotaxis protein
MSKFFSFGSGAASTLDAIGKSLAIIEFEPTGKIIWANANFCQAMGYSLDEIKGRHHSMFVDPAFAQTSEYAAFWTKLGRGEFDSREYRRFGKGGREVWIQASYNPVVSRSGKVTRIVKIAADITEAKLKAVEDAGKLAAISRSQAVIEFTPEGAILTANENFLTVLGYRLEEIKGQHHRMFVDPTYANSASYSQFWDRLRNGEFVADMFQRVGKGGKPVWIQASYNPIIDMNGKVCKVVKFATDVTDRVKAVEVLAVGLSKLAAGDLKQELATPFPPALEKLRLDFNNSVSSLRTVMLSVGETGQAVETGTAEISDASRNLSTRTEQQAANLEETAAALAEITDRVKKTAEGTKLAHQSMHSAKEGAEKSGQVVQRAVEAMAAIEKSSSEITQIIGVIDEIAFQTNLLALNAGVEAARAGDAGRGFAVVASEVRGLAQRSADAAKQIKALITQSTAQVSSGVDLVATTGKSLREIIDQVNQVAGIISDINSSANEQATSLGEVNVAVNQLDQITQQNAAMVEEATAASTSINGKARELTDLLAKFDMDQRASVHPIKKPSTVENRNRATPAASVAKLTNMPRRASAGAAVATKRALAPAIDDWQDF